MKRLLSAVISLSIIATNAVGLNINSNYVNAITADGKVLKGSCGDDASWLINSDGVLVVTGDGNLSTSSDWDWMKYQAEISEVVIENGISSVTDSSALKIAFGYPYCYNYFKITFPPSMTKLYGCLYDNTDIYTNLKDIYVYSRNITDAAKLYNPRFTLYANSGIIWHIYKDSQTEDSLREGLHLTDSDIEYIPDNEEMPSVANKEPVKLEPSTETSGPSGLFSKWEWEDSSKTLTFSGKSITIADDYKKYAKTTEHIVIESGIEKIDACTGLVIVNNSNVSQAFYGFTALKDVKLADTLKEIGDFSFYQTPINKIIDGLPEGLKKIGFGAFSGSNLEEISFPKSLNEIGESAFSGTNIKSINLHSGMYIGGSAFKECQSLKEITIPNDVTFYRTTEGGQGMAREHGTFINCTGLEKIIIQDGQKITNVWEHVLSINGLTEQFCKGCRFLKIVIIGGNVDYISVQTFDDCPSLSDMYFYTPDLNTIEAKGENDGKNESIDSDSDPTYYVIKDSKTEQTLKDAGYLTGDNFVYLATEDDINELNEALEKTADTSKFTEDYTKKFTESVNSGKAILDKYKTDKFSGITLDEVEKVLNVLDNPEYKPADYTSVDEALEKAKEYDLSKYTDESVKALQDAINAVEKGLDITNQDKVDAFAKAIEDAIKGLVVKKTDSKPNKPNNSGTSKNPNVKPATSVPITTRSPSQVAKDKKNAKKKINQAKITNLKAKSKSKKKITVSWKKVKKAVGYEVQISKTRKFKKALFDKFTTKKKITFKKKLKSGKIYYVRVRAYATYKDAYGKPQKVYSKWIKKVRKVKVK